MLSPHFTIHELTRSDTATRRSIGNVPSAIVIENMRALAALLEQVQDTLGTALLVRSGYRSPDLNRAVGGSITSQHCQGEAVDFEGDGIDNLYAARALAESPLAFDQLILECHTPGIASSGWLHLSLRSRPERGPNRRQVMTATKQGGAWAYLPGLP